MTFLNCVTVNHHRNRDQDEQDHFTIVCIEDCEQNRFLGVEITIERAARQLTGIRRAPYPRLSRLTRFYDLVAGWKLDSLLFIRYRPRDSVCV
jgi:hypothetical protein